jgi:membrane protein implicated in regulation of membrane protease activity
VPEQKMRNVDDPAAEILATSGLITMLGAVMAGVIAIVTLGSGSAAMAGILGAVALISFAASMVCFAADSRRSEETPLPFPSWLRTESETAAELSALG